jgi:hypothetical protein
MGQRPVAEVVKGPEGLCDPCSYERRAQARPHERARITRAPACGVAEDAVVLAGEGRASIVLGRQLGGPRPEFDQPAQRTALGGRHPPVDESFAHITTLLRQLHMPPPMAEQLAAAHRGAQGGERDRPRRASPGCLGARRTGIKVNLSFTLAGGGPQARDLDLRAPAHLRLLDRRPLDAGHGVAGRQAQPH